MSKIEAFRVSLPLVRAFETSSHRKAYLEHILIRVQDGDGAVGWGEIASPSDPYYCPETVEDCLLMVDRYLASALLAAEWEHPADVGAAWARIRGHEFAKAGVEMACWDLWCRATGRPLAGALGGTRPVIEAGVSLGIERTVDDLLAQVDRYAAEGYRRIKLKIAPGWDVEPVRAVRAARPGLPLHVDANGAYTEDQDAVFTELDDFGLTMIEQPYAPGALAAHARLQARIVTPLCLDESVEDLDRLDTAITLEAGRILNIKVSRMGGLTPARAAHDRAVAAGWQVWCGGMHEFGVGRAANVAIASLPGFTLPSDVSGSDKYYERDVVEPPIRAADGLVPVPSGPGLGHEVDEDLVRSLATAVMTW
ncbi:o-succinylbenzoate synthase [Actinoallomurus rhizosphaericola]|uniref:o-succinylbenzoate synthase n=1 Tax=Actinoallomurus rhizosphaericola TaxID=2952536 RepID=UPI0020920853|nr:o-succinylbenzoate synthase [Actinoallomurus rhizosphaericola]MCO5999754.1 o-succinylbenzoate synthase [Actinoallomurus rhizosphaericola]